MIYYALLSVFAVSIISLIGIFALAINKEKLQKILLYFVSFSAGALFGDVFIHLIPEISETADFSLKVSLYILSGIALMFLIEKVIQWRHCHHIAHDDHPHPFALMNLFGDSVHNYIDGLLIGASFIVSLPVGIATTLAVLLHEIPQEIGDFAILLHGGFTKKKALFVNFLTSLIAVAGTLTAFIIESRTDNLTSFLIPFAAGSFVYIAGSDLIPELHKESDNYKKSLLQFLIFLLGIAIMIPLLILE